MKFDAKLEKMMQHILAINNNTDELSGFEKVYATSNEHLFEMFLSLNIKDKNILTVGSSGDQILYSILFGAKDITCFDINPFVKYFFDYKVAIIKTLKFEEFIKIAHFCNNKFCNNIKNEFLSFSNYQKISHNLPKDSKLFWDNVFLETDAVINFYCEKLFYFQNTYILSSKIYNLLQKKLICKDYVVNFITSEINNVFKKLPNNKKYDAIILSNIFFYLNYDKKTEERYKDFYNLIEKFKPYLNKNGKIQLDYIYNTNFHYSVIKNFKKTFGKNKISLIPNPLDDEASVIFSPDCDTNQK